VLPYGPGIGVMGRGTTGVEGRGGTGIKGFGGDPEGRGTGVYGWGIRTGVKGEGDEAGVFGIGSEGVGGSGTNHGVRGYGGLNGVTGTGETVGVEGGATGSGEESYGGYFWSQYGIGIYAASGTADTYAGFFNGDVYSYGSFQTSDKNLKQNVQELGNAMSIIGKLKPKNYEFKSDEKLANLHLPKGRHYGLLAQEVEEVLPNLVKEVRHNLSATKMDDFRTLSDGTSSAEERKAKMARPAKEVMKIKAVNYTELIPIVVKGMQELAFENKELKDELADLKERLLKLETLLTSKGNGTIPLTAAHLEQNSPNPVKNNTIIRYHVPTEAASVKLTITNVKGQVIKEMSISNRGAGQVNLNASSLAAGTYNYSLWVNGQNVDTKRLIITR
jgi:hypothetical protein